jgi:hypothetical protein
VDVTGDWQVEVQFVYGRATHSVHVEQQGAELSGTYRSQYGQFRLTGRVSADRVTLRGPYELTGTVRGDRIDGTAQVGQEWPAAWSAWRAGPGDGNGR